MGNFLNEYSDNETFFGKLIYNLVKVLIDFGSLATLLSVIILVVVSIYIIIKKPESINLLKSVNNICAWTSERLLRDDRYILNIL